MIGMGSEDERCRHATCGGFQRVSSRFVAFQSEQREGRGMRNYSSTSSQSASWRECESTHRRATRGKVGFEVWECAGEWGVGSGEVDA